MRPAGGRAAGVALAGIILFGCAIHLPFLGSASLWLDEGLTVVPAMRADGFGSLITEVRRLDTQPPLSHLVIYLLRDRLSGGEFGLRLPNFIGLQLGLIFLFLAIRRVWGPTTALVTVALAQISPYLAFYGAEARNYGFWFAMIGASWWLLLRWTRDGAPGRSLLVTAWGVVNGLGLLVHLFHIFALVTQWAVIGAMAAATPRGPSRRRLLTAGAAGTLIAGLLFSPWAMVLFTQAAQGEAGVNWTRAPSLKTIIGLPYAVALGFSWGPGLREAHTLGIDGVMRRHGAAVAVAAVIMAALVLATVRLLFGRNRRGCPADRAAFLLIPVVGAAGPLAYTLATHFPLHPRHMLFLAPLVPLLMARLILEPGLGRWAAVALVALRVGALYNLRADPTYAKDDERGAVRFAEQHSTGPACIVGDVAPLYVTHATGLIEQFSDLRDPRVCAGVADLWWIENRPWEDPDGRTRRRIERAASERGLVSVATESAFVGVTLHHWRRGAAAEEMP